MCLAPIFKNNFQNTKNKKRCLGDHKYFCFFVLKVHKK